MSVARYWEESLELPSRHPNELDQRRIARALKQRERYRYVEPQVLPMSDGYLIRSACCSRNIDPEGGEIDVALLRWSDGPPEWRLFRKDHGAGNWVPDSRFARLDALLRRLNADPDRLFWQ